MKEAGGKDGLPCKWDKLIAYLDDGRVQIDNNLVENAIRPSAIGKKNWLFMGKRHTQHLPVAA